MSVFLQGWFLPLYFLPLNRPYFPVSLYALWFCCWKLSICKNCLPSLPLQTCSGPGKSFTNQQDIFLSLAVSPRQRLNVFLGLFWAKVLPWPMWVFLFVCLFVFLCSVFYPPLYRAAFKCFYLPKSLILAYPWDFKFSVVCLHSCSLTLGTHSSLSFCSI